MTKQPEGNGVIQMKKTARVIAGFMLVAAIVFFLVALNHPEFSWPWNNTVSYILYSVYALVVIILFVISFKKDA